MSRCTVRGEAAAIERKPCRFRPGPPLSFRKKRRRPRSEPLDNGQPRVYWRRYDGLHEESTVKRNSGAAQLRVKRGDSTSQADECKRKGGPKKSAPKSYGEETCEDPAKKARRVNPHAKRPPSVDPCNRGNRPAKAALWRRAIDPFLPPQSWHARAVRPAGFPSEKPGVSAYSPLMGAEGAVCLLFRPPRGADESPTCRAHRNWRRAAAGAGVAAYLVCLQSAR